MFLLIQRLPALAAPQTRLEALGRIFRPFAPLHFLRTCLAMRPLLAIAMVLLVAAPWYIAVGFKTDGAFLREFFVFSIHCSMYPALAHQPLINKIPLRPHQYPPHPARHPAIQQHNHKMHRRRNHQHSVW